MGTRKDFYDIFPKKKRIPKVHKIFDIKPLEGEKWKEIPNEKGYKISNIGRVFNPITGKLITSILQDNIYFIYIKSKNIEYINL